MDWSEGERRRGGRVERVEWGRRRTRTLGELLGNSAWWGEYAGPDQPKRSGSGRGGCAPCPIDALARPTRAPWEEAAVGPLVSGKQNSEESNGKVRGARKKGAMVFVKCLGSCMKI